MSDQWLLMKAGATVVVVRAALWVVPFRYLRPMLERDCAAPTMRLRNRRWRV